MPRKYARSFLLSRCKKLDHYPLSWGVSKRIDASKYVLDLRMSSLMNFKEQAGYAFALVSSNQGTPDRDKNVLEDVPALEDPFRYPELVIKLDLSLNEMHELSMGDLVNLPELRSIDLSLNNLRSFEGIGVARKLVYLNVSYNKLHELPHKSISQCTSLKHLNLSGNKIKTLSGFPALPDLSNLNVSSNKLENLDGIQCLRSLRQLLAQDNKINNTIHMCACLDLTEVNISNNQLETLSDVIASINPLKKLQQLYIKDNPVVATVTLLELRSLVADGSNVTILDGFNIKSIREQFNQFASSELPQWREGLKAELKQAVRQSMTEKVKIAEDKAHEDIKYYQRKIHLLLKAVETSRDKAALDTEAWCRYIDTLSRSEAEALTVSKIQSKALTGEDGSMFSGTFSNVKS